MKQLAFPSIWNLPTNPVFRRHAVARLRPLPLVAWLLVTQILAGFIWTITFLVALRRASGHSEALEFDSPGFQTILDAHGMQASLLAWLMVVLLQWIILFFKGTFSVATGVAREAAEGMMDAQRLTPLPTGHKVVGQLAGLPIQEHVVAGMLALWAIPSIMLGGLSYMLVVKIYLILLTSAALHHAIGLVAGTVIRQKILAGTLSQVLVVVLNFGLPLAGYFGIGAISHLGTSTATLEVMQVHLAEHSWMLRDDTAIHWFGHPLPAAFYTWVLTMVALALLVSILYRRWKDETSQLLGKPGTLAAVAFLLIVSWGEFHNFQPSIDWLERSRFVTLNMQNPKPSGQVATMMWVPGYAMVLCLVNLLAATLLAPSPAQRSLYRHATRPRPWHDGANAIPWLVAICLLTSITFLGVSKPIMDFNGFDPMHPAAQAFITLAFVVPACFWLLVIVRLGWRHAAFIGFFWGVLPVLVGILVVVVTGDLFLHARWILPTSGVFLPMFAWLSDFGARSISTTHSLTVPLLLSLALHLGALAWLAWRRPTAIAGKKPGNPH